MTRLVFVSGSLRRGSVNSALVRAARRAADSHPDVSGTSVLSLHELPFYDGDVEAAAVPPVVRRAWDIVREADALVISTPSYNGEPPGVLKNALDWLSRPAGSSVLQGKVVATSSASPGRLGGADSQQRLRVLLDRCGCRLVETEPLVAISDAIRKCSPSGELTDAEALSRIAQLVEATVAVVPARRTAELAGAAL